MICKTVRKLQNVSTKKIAKKQHLFETKQKQQQQNFFKFTQTNLQTFKTTTTT